MIVTHLHNDPDKVKMSFLAQSEDDVNLLRALYSCLNHWRRRAECWHEKLQELREATVVGTNDHIHHPSSEDQTESDLPAEDEEG